MINITGSGFGVKKGKVLLQRGVVNPKTGKVKTTKVTLKVVKDTSTKKDKWTDTSVTAMIPKELAVGVYDLVIQPKKVPPISHKASFSVVEPEIGSMRPTSGRWPDVVTLWGRYFGSVPGAIFITYLDGEKRIGMSCKVTDWQMYDPVTGDSQVTFIVPCGLLSMSDQFRYDVSILNGTGWHLKEGVFRNTYRVPNCPGGGSSERVCPPDCGW
jgi:hypothetical protein